MTKSPFKSWTLWVNVAGAAAVAVLTQLGAVLDAEWVAIALAAANFALRFKTTQPVI
jgi:hypothetical protein